MNSESLKSKKKTIFSLQAIRAFACIIIFIYHAVHSDASLAFGLSSLSTFFILSGFVLTISYWDRPVETTLKSAVGFSVKKIKPLFCLHVIMLLVGLAKELITPEQSALTYLYELAITVPLIQTLFPVGYQAFNSVDWYLSATMILYCIFPFLLRFLRKQNNGIGKNILMMICVYLLMLAAGACVGIFLPQYTTWITKDFPFYRLGDFFIGCVLGKIYKERGSAASESESRTNGFLLATVLEISAVIGICVSSVLCFTVFNDVRWFTNACLFIPSSAWLIHCMAREKGAVSKIITNPVTIYMGGISVYFYLIHRQTLLYIYFGLQRLFSIQINKWLLVIIAFPVTLMLVHIYLFLEKKIKNRFLRKS